MSLSVYRARRVSLLVVLAVAAQLALIPRPALAAPLAGVVRQVHTDPAGVMPQRSGPVRASSGGETQTAQSATPACSGTHSRGYQMVYARPSDVGSRLASLQSAFLSDVAAAQSRVAGEATSAPKRPRLFCGIVDVQTGRPAALYGADPLPMVMDDLALSGYSRTDRKYIVWWDGPNHPYACGEGTFVDDEQSSTANGNNSGPDYAVVYKPPGGGSTFCGWDTVLHEVGHTLGSVMRGAPNATANWHCRDENDVMCYVEPGGSTFVACTGTTIHFDCNGDDYFSASPAPGSYLATHWNTYNSSWLEATTLPAPNTTITSGPSGSGNGTSASFAFTSTIGGSTFTCALDGGAGSACASPKAYTNLSDGSHTFSVYATASGVADATPATRTWSVTASGPSAPDTILSATPAAMSKNATAAFEFSSGQGGATFTCAIDGGGATACTSPASYPGLADGAHAFEVTASAGGVPDPTPATFDWTIDTVVPTVDLLTPTAWIQPSRSFRIEWSAGDAQGVPIQRILMRKASTAQAFGGWSVWSQQSSPGATFVGGAGWTYCFVVEVYDPAGNRSVTPQRCTAIPIDDRWTPASKFERRVVSGFFDNTGSVALSSGATMTLANIRARRIDMRVQMCRACRYIDVYWNGQRIKQMSLATNDPRMVSIPLATFGSVQTGTLKLVVTSPVIVVDSLGVGQI